MSFERREALIDGIVSSDPKLGQFLANTDRTHDLSAASWDGKSFSFQLGFEALWDNETGDGRGLLIHPLLMLWRQSIELALKSAIVEIEGNSETKINHDLKKGFERLVDLAKRGGLSVDDHLTDNVKKMIVLVQQVDPFADRFRYPTKKDGTTFEGLAVDLDQLFQAHWIIVTYCEGTVAELTEKVGLPLELT